MAEPSVPRAKRRTRQRKHRRIAYRVQLNRPFRHNQDTDVIDGLYRDSDGDPIGQLLVAEQPHRKPETFLVIPAESLSLLHVEAALERDHRVKGYEQVFGLLYDPDEEPAAGVRASGDRWESGDLVVYTFETDEDALSAQQYAIGTK